MSKEILKQSDKIFISTGNVLGFTKKVGQKPVEELIDCLDVTFRNAEYNKVGEVHRIKNDLLEIINEHERNSLKIGAKIFINNFATESITEAVEGLLKILEVDALDNFVLAYHPNNKTNDDEPTISNNKSTNSINNEKSKETTNGDILTSNSVSESEAFEWAPNKNANAFNELKQLWNVLGEFHKEHKICQLGISDLDTDTLKQLYESCEIKPVIAKINLASCCVVPPSLQEFCNKQDIQLLTHSDPEVFLEENSLEKWDLSEYEVTWVVRYQVHIKCRGVLALKGYLVGASKRSSK